MTWYDVIKGFAGPVATIAAALAAVGVTRFFGWRQVLLASEKLRYDLFDRRLAVFESVFPFYEALISWKGTPEQLEAQTRFFKAYQVSQFLFGTETGVEDLLKKMNEDANIVIGFHKISDQLKADPDVYLKEYHKVIAVQSERFPKAIVQLKAAMSKDLNFHKLP